MMRYLAAALATGLMTGALIASAPPARAGCLQYPVIVFPLPPANQLCDGPIQPDGTWQRCEEWDGPDGQPTTERCYPMGNGIIQPESIYQQQNHIDP